MINKWICGCEERNSCIVFNVYKFDREDTWTKNGVRNKNHLASKAKYHKNSKVQMKYALSILLFGKLNIAEQLDSDQRKSIHKHNENVNNNRYILNITVNFLKFLEYLGWH